MEQINIHKMNEELMALKLEVAKMKEMIMGEDWEFSRRINEAWGRYDKGEFKEASKEEFMQELEKW